jgi:hypothetical protein
MRHSFDTPIFAIAKFANWKNLHDVWYYVLNQPHYELQDRLGALHLRHSAGLLQVQLLHFYILVHCKLQTVVGGV